MIFEVEEASRMNFARNENLISRKLNNRVGEKDISFISVSINGTKPQNAGPETVV